MTKNRRAAVPEPPIFVYTSASRFKNCVFKISREAAALDREERAGTDFQGRDVVQIEKTLYAIGVTDFKSYTFLDAQGVEVNSLKEPAQSKMHKTDLILKDDFNVNLNSSTL